MEFEPAVHTEETPGARVVIFDLPGFRREDLRVQINSRGNLIVSGERGLNEMGEIKKAGGRSEKTQSEGNTFRKVIVIPEIVNTDGITAKLKDQVLRVSLPFIQKDQTSPTEDFIGGGKPHVADLPEQSKPDERFRGGKPHVADLPEQSKTDERFRGGKPHVADLPEQSKPDERFRGGKPHVVDLPEQSKTDERFRGGKPNVADLPEQSKPDERFGGGKPHVADLPEQSKTDERFGGGKPHVADLPEQSKPDERSSPVKQLQGLIIKQKAGAAVEETKGSLEEEKNTEAPKQAPDFVLGEPPILTPTHAVSAQHGSDRDHSQFMPFKLKPRKKDEYSWLSSSNAQFPEKRIQNPFSTGRSVFFNSGVLIAWTVLVFCAGMYFSYILGFRKADGKP